MTLIEILESREEALNAHQVAELLGLSKKKVYQMAATGRLPSFRIGKAVRFDAQDLADWLRKKKPSNEQPGLRRPQKEGGSRPDRKGQESGPPDHIWRGKVRSLEAGLATEILDPVDQI
jgi:excisionase family DNA binding protein